MCIWFTYSFSHGIYWLSYQNMWFSLIICASCSPLGWRHLIDVWIRSMVNAISMTDELKSLLLNELNVYTYTTYAPRNFVRINMMLQNFNQGCRSNCRSELKVIQFSILFIFIIFWKLKSIFFCWWAWCFRWVWRESSFMWPTF